MGMGITAARPGRHRLPTAALAAVVVLLVSACGDADTAAPSQSPPQEDQMATTGPTDPSDPTGSSVPPPSTGASTPVDPSFSMPVAGAMVTDPAGADLVVVVGAPGAEQPPVTLSCDWRGGTATGSHPDAATACRDLLAAVQAGDPFAPVSPDAMCAQVFGGDAVVAVSGAVLDAAGGPLDVQASFTLTDGCQIDRFDRMGAVLSPYRGAV